MKSRIVPSWWMDWIRPLIIGFIFGMIGIFGLQNGILDKWNQNVTDAFALPYPASDRIIVIEIDDRSLAEVGAWPWSYETHTALMKRLGMERPEVIAYGLPLPEQRDIAGETAFAKAIKDAGSVVVSAPPVDKSLPPAIAQAVVGEAVETVEPDADGVVRRVTHRIQRTEDGTEWESLALKTAETVGVTGEEWRGSDANGARMVQFADRSGKAFYTVSAADVLKNKISISLHDRILFVGRTTGEDRLRVPVGRSEQMSPIEVHAQAFDNLLAGRFLLPLPGIVISLWILAIGLIIGLIVPRFKRPRNGVWAAICIWSASIFITLVLFWFGWTGSVFWISVTAFLATVAVLWDRKQILSVRRKWAEDLFSRHVSLETMDHVLCRPKKAALDVERREVTILFADIRGFSEQADARSPSDVIQVLNRFFQRVTRSVFKQGGVVDKYVGDAVMAFWNAPVTQEDHAARAIEAAIDMKESIEEAGKNGRFGDWNVGMGIGVHTGPAIVGHAGSEDRTEYMVLGTAVKIATRLQELSEQYGSAILISETTREAIGESFVLRPVDVVQVEGVADPIGVYEVISYADEATEADREWAKKCNEALFAYLFRRFEEAEQLADVLLQEVPEDLPNQLIRERASHLKKNPPPDDWGGVWVDL